MMAAAQDSIGCNPIITYTLFPDVTPRDKTERTDVPWTELVARIVKAAVYLRKADCPLISLAEYGDALSEAGCIRHAANVRRIFGVELDYDGEEMPPEEAAALLAGAALECVLYTSPSHTEQRPRWRALFPLSEPALPDERATLVARANRVLKGGASRESFTLSQSFYIGRIRGALYVAIPIHGRTVDQAADLEPLYFTGDGSTGKTKVSTVTDAELRERFRSGDGRYEAMLSLSARWAARGMSAPDIAANLTALLEQGNTTKNADGIDLLTRVEPMATSAVAKFGETRRRQAEPIAAELAPVEAYEDEPPTDQAPTEPVAPGPTETVSFDPDQCRVSLDVFENAPPAPEMVVHGYLPCDIAVRYGEGGTGKTTLSLYEAIHIILGQPILGFEVMRPGPVLMLSGEDDRRRIEYRLHHVCKALQLSAEAVRYVQARLYVIDASAVRIPLVVGAEYDQLVETVHLQRLIDAYGPIGLAATYIDPAVSFGPGERYVNDGEQALMTALRRFRREVGGGLFLQHHVSKQASRDAVADQYAGRGGAAMSDAARAVHVLLKHDLAKSDLPLPPTIAAEEVQKGRVLRSHVPKLTDGHAHPDAIWIRRTDGWGFERVAAARPEDAIERALREVVAFVRAQARDAVRHTPRSLRDRAPQLRLTKRQIEAAVEHGLMNGALVERALPDDEKRGARKTFLEAV
jgi:hypothetical protein